MQNADGGWGESCASYGEGRFVPAAEHAVANRLGTAGPDRGRAGGERSLRSRQSRYLVSTQRPDGTWDEPRHRHGLSPGLLSRYTSTGTTSRCSPSPRSAARWTAPRGRCASCARAEASESERRRCAGSGARGGRERPEDRPRQPGQIGVARAHEEHGVAGPRLGRDPAHHRRVVARRSRSAARQADRRPACGSTRPWRRCRPRSRPPHSRTGPRDGGCAASARAAPDAGSARPEAVRLEHRDDPRGARLGGGERRADLLAVVRVVVDHADAARAWCRRLRSGGPRRGSAPARRDGPRREPELEGDQRGGGRVLEVVRPGCGTSSATRLRPACSTPTRRSGPTLGSPAARRRPGVTPYVAAPELAPHRRGLGAARVHEQLAGAGGRRSRTAAAATSTSP